VKKRETDTAARVTNPRKRSHCDGADGSKPEIDLFCMLFENGLPFNAFFASERDGFCRLTRFLPQNTMVFALLQGTGVFYRFNFLNLRYHEQFAIFV
jgi:hypothetical protein